MEPEQSSILFQLITAAVALFACGLFSFMETSITALRIFNLKELAKKTNKYHTFFEALEKEPQRVLIAILIGSCLVNVIAADAITTIMDQFLQKYVTSAGLCFFGSITLTTIAILIFGDILPKNIAQARFERLFVSTLWIANIIFYIMSPFVKVFSTLTRYVIGWLRPTHHEEEAITEQEIRFLIDYIDKNGKMESTKSRMLTSIFELSDTIVQDIMVPESNVVSLPVTATLEDALDCFVRSSYSRLPIYDGIPSNIIGMLHQKDLLLVIVKKIDISLQNLMRPILFVSEGMSVNNLLYQFKEQRQHIAIVTSEDDLFVGLVTLEDAIEEIVGDINDEHESVAQYITELNNNSWLVFAGVDLKSLEPLLNITFETKVDTVGDFLMEHFKEIPKKGELLSYKNYTFKVEKTTQKRIVHVLIFKNKI